MNDSIPDSVASAVTPSNPYLVIHVPAIARVYDAIVRLSRAAGGAPLQIGVRQLAIEAGLQSAGGISPMLRRMAGEGRITYDRAASIITVIDADQTRDRIPHQDATDHTSDRSAAAAPQQDAIPTRPIDQREDRVKTGCMEDHDSKLVVVHGAQARAPITDADPPRPWSTAGVSSPRIIAELESYGIAPAQFARLLALKRRSRNPTGVAIDAVRGARVRDADGWEQWLSDLEGSRDPRDDAGGGRPPAHHRDRSAAGRPVARRPVTEQPAPAFRTITDLPPLRLDLSAVCG